MTQQSPSHGVKRPRDDSTSHPHTRRKVRRKLQHVQIRPQHVETAPQDPVFTQGQLLKSIGAALTLAGFDGVKQSALEMFRAHVEEYMLNFLHDARTSMQHARRTTPTAQDFAFALASSPNTSTASLLRPQLSLNIPLTLSFPTIAEPGPAVEPAPDYSGFLAPLMDSNPPTYIPNHFPKLPPKHAWQYTDDYPEREKDARKMRERATQEGIMAEQALRKLAAAAKAGAAKVERRRLDTLSGPGRRREDVTKGRGGKRKVVVDRPSSEEIFGDMMKEVAGRIDQDENQVLDLGVDGTKDLREQGVDVGMPDGILVNSEMNGWRRGQRKGVRV